MIERPEYELYKYEDLADALAEIRRQWGAGEPLVWTGPDNLHHAILASNPPPSEKFSPEGMEYDAERGRDFWEVYTHVAFMLGYHQGTVREQEHRDFYKRLDDLQHEHYMAMSAKLQKWCPHEETQFVEGLHSKQELRCRECGVLRAAQG